MITGVDIKQENFKPLNKEYNEEKKAALMRLFCSKHNLEFYLMSISF